MLAAVGMGPRAEWDGAGGLLGGGGAGLCFEGSVLVRVQKPGELYQHDFLLPLVAMDVAHDLGELLLELADVVVEDFVLLPQGLLVLLALVLEALVVPLAGLALQNLEHLVGAPVELFEGLHLALPGLLARALLHLCGSQELGDDGVILHLHLDGGDQAVQPGLLACDRHALDALAQVLDVPAVQVEEPVVAVAVRGLFLPGHRLHGVGPPLPAPPRGPPREEEGVEPPLEPRLVDLVLVLLLPYRDLAHLRPLLGALVVLAALLGAGMALLLLFSGDPCDGALVPPEVLDGRLDAVGALLVVHQAQGAHEGVPLGGRVLEVDAQPARLVRLDAVPGLDLFAGDLDAWLHEGLAAVDLDDDVPHLDPAHGARALLDLEPPDVEDGLGLPLLDPQLDVSGEGIPAGVLHHADGLVRVHGLLLLVDENLRHRLRVGVQHRRQEHVDGNEVEAHHEDDEEDRRDARVNL
mmetsp:Transcript_67567/g.177189  ORF Transcript_67567/g.177189 Transcript_67567/m.177189 type:complete len:466 (-) Transcript_67567:3631-5028(-)